MITTQELRQGNFLIFRGAIRQVYGLKPNWIWFDDIDCNPDNAEPVVLNEEWLKRFGFTKTEHSTWTDYDKCNFNIQQDKTDMTYNFVFENYLVNKDDVTIVFVHQLQNLYFSLTGEELK